MEWIQADKGKARSLRSEIYKGKIDELLKWVKEYQTTSAARSITANDLEKILKYTDPGTGRYTRICDLQGFFMKAGGFVTADPGGVQEGEPLDYTCYSVKSYPTTKKTIEALEKMVKALRPSADNYVI